MTAGDHSAWSWLLVALLLAWPAHNLVLAAFGFRVPRPRRPPSRRPLHFWIIVPALNEELVVGNTVRAALALDAPYTPVRVLVVDDGSDDRTPEVLAAIDDPRLTVLRRDLPDARQGKGVALNVAYRRIREIAKRERTTDRTVLGVIDGDGRGSPNLLREVSAFFADQAVGAVQCRVRIHNRRPVLGLLQDIELACVADATQSLRDLVGTVSLGGNGQFTRLRELIRFGDNPWSECLVEDLELGLRLHLAGARIRYCRTGWVTQQAVVDSRRLLRQRTRWAQGNLQCLGYVPRLAHSPAVGSVALLDFLHCLLTPWATIPLSALVAVVLGLTCSGLVFPTPGSPLAAAGSEVWAAGGAILAAAVGPGLLWAVVHRGRLRDARWGRCLLAGLCYPAFLLLGVAATWRALVRHLLRRQAWVKTERLVETAEPVAPPPAGVVFTPARPGMRLLRLRGRAERSGAAADERRPGRKRRRPEA
ncbi:glycosyltransferase [Streptoalloteichus hindustanus]|uniref:Glycosyltransferase, catalytic subunit of cellulose synthase and poly-beta-1,6-N-acetylglucosamine synthase n=1 Tax=Streptoalloteichus hindustanus TaxID=2017 RepID=A0A1M5MX20_STRHI|nr:glycosyltransferase [Streptoalloteichus hindustanus]SHG81890.1 Glycosyltransferase, catalytic subunit of cellulose synthase and poly-beta-1,6-N-acetylglucosamine synthase [Streptoalloteichus hindustanus]